MKTRPYQREAVTKTLSAWKETPSALIVMPTGTGKTVVFASIIRARFPKKAMVIAHRQELVWQARERIQEVTGLTVDIEMGAYKSRTEAGLFQPKASVIVSTVQTHVAGGDGGGRIGKFDPYEFGTLIIDEGHHATSPSYRRIIDYYRTNPNLVVLGVTATPDRADEEALGQVFEQVSFKYEVLDAIKDGWLVPIEQQMVSVDTLDFSKVRTTAGDLNGADLAAVMESEKNLHGIASSTIEIIGERRGIGFASSVNHAKILSDIFNRHRMGMSSWVCGKTDKEERKSIIEAFAKGKIQWLWNCGVFTEGFDDSGVEVISMARPTESRSLYAQMAGRATRPHKSIAHKLNDIPVGALRRLAIGQSVKPSCLIIDYVGNSGKHKLMTTADILGGNYSEEAIKAATDFAIRTGKPLRISKTIEEQEELLEAKKKRELEESARKSRLVIPATYKMQKVDPFDLLQVKPVTNTGIQNNKVLSERQRKVLKNAGYNPDSMEYGRAAQLVSLIVERFRNGKCSLGQAKLLKKFGQDVNMSKEAAKKTIDAIAKNGWKVPENFEAPEVTPIASAIPQEVQGDSEPPSYVSDNYAESNVSGPHEEEVPF